MHQGTLSAGHHAATERLSGDEITRKVDGKHRRPVGLGDAFERAGPQDSGVVDQDISASLRLDRIRRCGNVVCPRHITLERETTHTQFGSERRRLRLVTVEQHDPHTFRSEGARQPLTDAASGAGDDGRLSLQSKPAHAASPSPVAAGAIPAR